MEDAVIEIMAPDPEEWECYVYAVELLTSYDRHGLLFAGGPMQQPAFEMHALNCVLTARERAQRETRAIEAYLRAQESAARQREAEEAKMNASTDAGIM